MVAYFLTRPRLITTCALCTERRLRPGVTFRAGGPGAREEWVDVGLCQGCVTHLQESLAVPPEPRLGNPHPGETLAEWLGHPIQGGPAGRRWNVHELAVATGMHAMKIQRLLRGETRITHGMAGCLARLGPSARFWLNLQRAWDEEAALCQWQQKHDRIAR